METELSFDAVVNAYTSTVYGVALTHTARRADADDVFQEVFFAYWRSKPDISSAEHLKAWLIRTTLNFCLKSTQSSWAKTTVYADDEGQGAQMLRPPLPMDSSLVSLDDFPFQTQQQAALYAAIRSLTEAHRTVVMLFYFEDLSIAQIAAVLQEEQGAVKTRLSRARAQLREKLIERKV